MRKTTTEYKCEEKLRKSQTSSFELTFEIHSFYYSYDNYIEQSIVNGLRKQLSRNIGSRHLYCGFELFWKYLNCDFSMENGHF